MSGHNGFGDPGGSGRSERQSAPVAKTSQLGSLALEKRPKASLIRTYFVKPSTRHPDIFYRRSNWPLGVLSGVLLHVHQFAMRMVFQTLRSHLQRMLFTTYSPRLHIDCEFEPKFSKSLSRLCLRTARSEASEAWSAQTVSTPLRIVGEARTWSSSSEGKSGGRSSLSFRYLPRFELDILQLCS